MFEPLHPGRDEAMRLLEAELSRQAYQEAKPSLLDRAIQWLIDEFSKLLARVGDVVPGNVFGVIAFAGLVLLLGGWLVRRRLGARVAPKAGALTMPERVSAAGHLQRARGHLDAGRLAEAIREGLRAIVRECEEAGYLEPSPSRTADEIAAVIGAALPETAGPVGSATTIFDDVWYGEREPTRQMAEAMLAVHDTVARACRTGAPR